MLKNTKVNNTKYWILLISEALLFIFIIGITFKCSSNKIDVLENNIIGYRDSLEYSKLKNGELLAVKQSLILDKENMLMLKVIHVLIIVMVNILIQ